MMGNLWLRSEYGRGSTFSAALPLVAAGEDALSVREEEFREFSAPRAKILVVDDIDINLEVAQAMLESFEISPDLAQSGRAALELVEKNNYHMVFMDHMMPEMDGIETTLRIRELPAGVKVPIIALTANVINGAESMFLQHHFDGLLGKPIEFSSLGRCLQKWLPGELIQDR
jgi:CheY-like chemotaxis protein